MKNNITIQINSIEALERLIGGSDEVELAIRQSVVENFAKRHFRDLANQFKESDFFLKLEKSLLKEYRTCYNERLKKSVKEDIEKLVKENTDIVAIDKKLNEMTEAVVYRKQRAEKSFQRILEDDYKEQKESAINQLFEAITSKNFEDRVAREVNIRLKKISESLGG